MATPFIPVWTERLARQILQRTIHVMVIVKGRKVDDSLHWAVGPAGEEKIGAGIYDRYAAAEGLSMQESPDAGLLVDFRDLNGEEFNAAMLHPAVREFYEHTANWTMEVKVKWRGVVRHFAKTLLYLVSREIEQVNLPLSQQDVDSGIKSRIIPLVDADGNRRFTGWLRQYIDDGTVIYAGFYTTAKVPSIPSPCVRVSFPMPLGCTTVILRPINLPDGKLRLASDGKRFGESGAYRMHGVKGKQKVAHLPLHERIDVWTDDDGGHVLCDHEFSIFRFRFLLLQYKLSRKI